MVGEVTRGRRSRSGNGSGERRERFATRDAARILGVSPRRIRSFVRDGLCRPGRKGRAFRFSFQDLVLLRTARDLARARVPSGHIRRALRELSRQLPADRPLSGVKIYASGRAIVVRDGQNAWHPDSGQGVLLFQVGDLERSSRRVLEVPPPANEPAPDTEDARREEAAAACFERGLELEDQDPAGAVNAYRMAIDLEPELTDAYINLGRLLHQQGELTEAVQLYRHAIELDPEDVIAHFNLGLCLEDQSQEDQAIRHYQRAIALDPAFADPHYNMGRLLENLGDPHRAMRHFMTYKRLTQRK